MLLILIIFWSAPMMIQGWFKDDYEEEEEAAEELSGPCNSAPHLFQVWGGVSLGCVYCKDMINSFK